MNPQLFEATHKISQLLQEQVLSDWSQKQDSDSFHKVKLDLIKKESSHLKPAELQLIKDEFSGLGILEQLIKDTEVSEIIVNDWNSLWIEKNGQLKPLAVHFLSETTYQQIFQKICELAHLQLTYNQPHNCSHWKNFRITASIPPLTIKPTLNLRRHGKLELSLGQLKSLEMLTSHHEETLKDWVHNKKNILFVGSTGAGKTTLLNSCLHLVPKNERVLILEDTQELSVPNSASLRLTTNKHPDPSSVEITLNDLVRFSLRMRPDRLVVGEVRGKETKDLLLALSSGHNGSFCTLHADTARQALLRLEMLVQLGAPQWDLQAIRRLIFLSIHGIVVLQKKEGVRKVSSLNKITGYEEFGLLLEEI